MGAGADRDPAQGLWEHLEEWGGRSHAETGCQEAAHWGDSSPEKEDIMNGLELPISADWEAVTTINASLTPACAITGPAKSQSWPPCSALSHLTSWEEPVR